MQEQKSPHGINGLTAKAEQKTSSQTYKVFNKHLVQTGRHSAIDHPKQFEPGHEKMYLMSYANNKGTDQPAQRLCCSLLR